MTRRKLFIFVTIALLAIGAGTAYAASLCGACGGRGSNPCLPCNGSGQVKTGTTWNSKTKQSDTTYGPCFICGGSGRKICGSCGGDGMR